ncbi:flagellar hook-associated protein FlgK [Sphingomonas donggukensis]|uniref:Flagellar hook-associated protein 1 n=1 Tax=Sphingomonas donggukensis TaxID=2949093 RepID=A0ABY4TSZ8_9SPHN|nr:flagellar hook-associated protein FlgK [Sphingomonas donggukensis]URW75533.1 flagellar hook-associated protein FlgK [Sphingomonas donggukensis]
MSDLFTIGYSGVRAYQAALGTTSENIANAGTAGYARRTATIAEVTRATSMSLGQTTNLGGNGSIVTGIARSADAFKVAEVRVAGADLARTETGVIWLDRVEGALTGNQLGERLTAFFNAGKAVAADPAAGAPRAVMLETASSLASAFAGTGRAIDAARADLKGSGNDAARKLTDLSDALARVNASLTRAKPASVEQAALFDERDRVLESMSALVDVDVQTDAYGRATARAGGSTGPVLADAAGSAFVTFTMNASGGVSFAANRGGGTELIPAHGGTLAGIADGAARVVAARETLDDLATRFTTGINELQADGRDLDGAAGQPMFTVGATPTEIQMTLTDPRGIAAAAVGEGVRGNGNMAALAAFRTDGAFETRLADSVTANAAALSARRDVASAQGTIRDAAVAAREGVSGVDLDEEAVNLIRFQQAYQASGRVIQVAREILQTIIDIR